MAEQRRNRKPAGRPDDQTPHAIEVFTVQTVNAALASQAPRAVVAVQRLRKEHPNLSPADILKKLEHRFLQETFWIGREAGKTAASEGTASDATIDTITGEKTLKSAVFFVLAATEALEVHHSELEDRAGLVRSVLLAEVSNKAIRRLASRAAPRLARKIVDKIPASSFKPINDAFGYRVVTKRGQTGDIVLEDVAANGLGSVIGIGTNALFTLNVIRVTKRTLERIRAASELDGEIVQEDADEPDDIVDGGGPGPLPK